MIAAGMWVQAGGIALIAGGTGFRIWATGSTLLGVGTAMDYPTLLAPSATWRIRRGEPRRSA